MKIDVVVRAIVDRGEVVEKALELVMDQNARRPTDRRRLVSYPLNDYSWLDELNIDQEYVLTIEPK